MRWCSPSARCRSPGRPTSWRPTSASASLYLGGGEPAAEDARLPGRRRRRPPRLGRWVRMTRARPEAPRSGLAIEAVTVRFAGLTALDGVSLRGRAGLDPCRHRAQRRRQVDAVQRGLGRLHAGRRGRCSSPAASWSACGRTRSPASASPAPSRTSPCIPTSTRRGERAARPAPPDPRRVRGLRAAAAVGPPRGTPPPGPGRRRSPSSSASAHLLGCAGRGPLRTATRRRSRSPGRCASSRHCCCWTSRSRA